MVEFGPIQEKKAYTNLNYHTWGSYTMPGVLTLLTQFDTTNTLHLSVFVSGTVSHDNINVQADRPHMYKLAGPTCYVLS